MEKYKVVFTKHFRKKLKKLSLKNKKKVLELIEEVKKVPLKGKKIKGTPLRYMDF